MLMMMMLHHYELIESLEYFLVWKVDELFHIGRRMRMIAAGRESAMTMSLATIES